MKQNKKQIDDTSEDQSDSSKEEQSKNKAQNNLKFNKRGANVDKIKQYLKFFNPILTFHQNPTSQSLQQLLTQIKVELSQLQTENQQLELSNNIEKSQNNINFRVFQLLQEFTQLFRNNIQSSHFNNSRFQKAHKFTKQLIILQINQSKHCEVVHLKIHFLSYITTIKILNQIGKSPLYHDAHINSSGSYGNVFLINSWQQNLCIKSLLFNDEIQPKNQPTFQFRTKKIFRLKLNTIKQYFFILLFSQLQIGPKVQTIGGFDIIIYEDSIEFATEICDEPHKDEENLKFLKQSLIKMHMLQVVHRDIKPTNIMFSPTFKKNVFIDFGGTEVLKQKLGQKTVTRFVGTTFYCSEEVFQLLSQKQMAVDLYYNDMYGLKKFQDQISFRRDQKRLNLKLECSQSVNKVSIISTKSLRFQLIFLKYLCFERDFERFRKEWQSLIKRYGIVDDEIERRILQFMKELRPCEQLSNFYWNNLRSTIRQEEAFESMEGYYRNGSNVLYDLCIDKDKKNLFNVHYQFYYSLKIMQQTNSRDQIKILKIIKDKQTIKKGLKELHQLVTSQHLLYKKQNKQLNNYLILVVHYCSLATNIYGFSINQKITLCQQALTLVQKYDQQNLNKIQITFNCLLKQFVNMHLFFHYFLFYVLKKVPISLRSQLMIISLSSLCLLGLPTKYNYKITQILFLNSIQSDTTNQQKFYKFNTLNLNISNIQEERISKINMFWQSKIITTFYFKSVFYDPQQVFSFIPQEKQQIHKIKTQILSLMTPKENQKNSLFFTINFKFYQKLYVNFHNFTQTYFVQLSQILKNFKLSDFQQFHPQIKKWKQLMQLTLFYLNLAYQSAYSDETTINFKDKVILQKLKDNLLFPYAIFYAEQIGHRKTINTNIILRKIDKMIECQELSLRFSLAKRLSNALQYKDTTILKKLCHLIQKQIEPHTITSQKLDWIRVFLIAIHRFFLFYLKQIPKLNLELIQIVKHCSRVIKLGLEIGINYFKSKLFLGTCCQQNHFMQMIFKKIGIYQLLLNKKLVKNFILSVVSTGEHYIKIIQIIRQQQRKSHTQSSIKTFSSINTNYQSFLSFNIEKEKFEIFQENHKFFMNQLELNKKLIDFSPGLINQIFKNQELSNKIKSDKQLSIEIVIMFMQQRKNKEQLIKTNELIEKLFGQLSSDGYKNQNWPQYLPPVQIAFDYFQVKLIKTNFDSFWCKQIIQMFNIFYHYDSIHELLSKNSLIRLLFNSYVYISQDYNTIIEFLQKLSLVIKKFPTKKLLNVVKQLFESMFWCLCEKCFPRKLQYWDPFQFALRLSQKVYLIEADQNPYMSLVYYYSLFNKELDQKISKKFVLFILRSMQYLDSETKQLMKTLIYRFKFSIIQPNPFIDWIKNQQVSNFHQIKKISKQMMNQSKQRKLIYLYNQCKKYQQGSFQTFEQLVQKRLIKQYYVKGYKYPAQIRSLFKKKIIRFHEVKQNFSQTQFIKSITEQYSVVLRFAIFQ